MNKGTIIFKTKKDIKNIFEYNYEQLLLSLPCDLTPEDSEHSTRC